MFELWWREDAPRTKHGRHLGLGLTIAKRSAEATGLRLIAEREADILRVTLSGMK